MTLLIGSLLVILIALFLKRYVKWQRNRSRFFKHLKAIPGPIGLPYFGSILKFSNQKDLKAVFMQLQEEYGTTYKFKLELKNYLITSDPELIEGLLTSNRVIDKPSDSAYWDKWLGGGLLISAGNLWKRNRKIIAPSFHVKILELFLPTFKQKAYELLDILDGKVGTAFDITSLLNFTILDIICETAMGVSANALKEGENSMFVKNVRFMTQLAVDRIFSPWKRYNCLYNLSSDARKEDRVVAECNELTKLIIRQRKCAAQNTSQRTKQKKLAFLDLLLKELDENGGSLSEKDVQSEVNNFMFAGYHSVSNTLICLLYSLAKNPCIQEALYAEFKNIDEDLNYANLQAMKYTEMVIKETLRLYPPAFMIGRQIKEDFKTSKIIYRVIHSELTVFNQSSNQGLLIPEGTQFCAFIYGLHRNERIYPNPNEFDPERFNTQNSMQRPPFAYIPFSAGPRNCIGQKFAMLEMKVLIYFIVKHFTLDTVPDTCIQVVGDSLLKTVNGVFIHFTKRNANNNNNIK